MWLHQMQDTFSSMLAYICIHLFTHDMSTDMAATGMMLDLSAEQILQCLRPS